MILIAPDKFKGTLTARQAAAIIADELSAYMRLKAPMADGGEGTASILCAEPQWVEHDCYWVHPASRTAVIDSSAIIGMHQPDLLRASSAPLGIKVREIIKGGCQKVIIGIGGTAVCDGGLGFLEGLGLDKYHTYRSHIVGLSDVAVPLLPADPDGDLEAQPSALMFARQKGATDVDFPILLSRLAQVQRQYSGGRTSPFDGAGGGLGFAIASAIDAPCYPGAQYVLDHYNIDWSRVDIAITGEGRIDAQTARGKAAYAVAQAAKSAGVPCIMIGGAIAEGTPCLAGSIMGATDEFLPNEPLTPEVAEERLRLFMRRRVLPILQTQK